MMELSSGPMACMHVSGDGLPFKQLFYKEKGKDDIDPFWTHSGLSAG